VQTTAAVEALRPTALIARRRETDRRTKLAVDTLHAVGYLIVTWIVVPIILAMVLVGFTWTRWAMEATIPLSVALGIAYGFEQRRDPVGIAWHLPNAVQLGPWTWQYANRDLIIKFRHWRHHRIWLWTAAGAAGAVWCWAHGSLALAGLISAAGLYRFLRKQPARVVTVPPHAAPRIRQAMLSSGLWTDKTLPPFHHLQPPETDEYGSTAWISLHGVSYRDLMKESHRIVAGFGLREKQLKIEHPPNMPADAVRLRFNNGHPRAPQEHWALKIARGL
jgi:hypothetical protein